MPLTIAPGTVENDPCGAGTSVTSGGGHVRNNPANAIGIWRRILTADDHTAFMAATGNSLDKLIDDIAKLPRRQFSKITGTNRVVPHPLNARGLHALRSLMAERLTGRLRSAEGWACNPQFATLYGAFMESGLVRLPLKRVPHAKEDATWVVDLLRMVSGLPRETLLHTLVAKRRIRNANASIAIRDLFPAAGAGTLATVSCQSTDIQHYMHVDTFQPTWKMWIFGEGTDATHGTLHYVPGSHRINEGKLRWLHNRTRTVLQVEAPLTNENHQLYGPFRDPAPGGGAGSIRYVGFDPRQPHKTLEADLASFGFNPIEPVVAPPGNQAMLVIADTSGLHLRGHAPGSQRQQLTLDVAGRNNPEDNVLPRLALSRQAMMVAARRRG